MIHFLIGFKKGDTIAERYELGQLLIMKGMISQQQLEEALSEQQKTKKFLGEILVEKGFVSKEILLECLTEQKKLIL